MRPSLKETGFVSPTVGLKVRGQTVVTLTASHPKRPLNGKGFLNKDEDTEAHAPNRWLNQEDIAAKNRATTSWL